MKCERCGAKCGCLGYRVSIPSPDPVKGYEHHKVCSECYKEWYEIIKGAFYKFCKGD